MSPIAAIEQQKRLRELGRIRTGDRTEKGAPNRLASFRLTSHSRELLAHIGHLYGGEPRTWKGAPDEGTWEVYITAPVLPVMVPPGQTLTQWNELWSGGGCQRRCDGITEQLTGEPCLCPTDTDERRDMANAGRACKPTTRLSVMLPDVPDIGMWRLESHGYYAAVELAGIMAVLERATATGALVPAQLRIEQRSGKRVKDGKPLTLRYTVPVLELPDVTPMQLARGYGLLPAGMDTLAAPTEAPALPEPVQAQVVLPPTAEPVDDGGPPEADGPEQWAALILDADSGDAINAIYKRMPPAFRNHDAVYQAITQKRAALGGGQA